MTTELATIEYQGEVISAVADEGPRLDRNPAAVYLATLRPTGRRSMQHYLNLVAWKLSGNQVDALHFDWSQLRYQHTAVIRAWVQQDYKVATANTIIKALRRVLLETWRLGLIEAEEYRRAADIHTIKGENLLKGRALAGGEIAALMNSCGVDIGPAGARDAALVAVLYGAGLRRSEIAKLELTDYNQDTGALTVRSGKGGKDRISYIGAGAENALTDWLTIRGNIAGPLFYPINRGGNIQTGSGLTAQAVLNILQKRGGEAKVSSFSPHDLRRTFISDLLDAGADIATVQKLAGHSNVQTTARYDRRGEVAKRKAAGLLHVPYNQRRRLKLD